MDNNIQAWPFVEAKRILESVQYKIPQKGFIALETGYGPSGLPHIGTFGEVIRTNFVMKAIKTLAPNIPVKLLVVSDDFDGMRKIPDNIPNPEKLQQYYNFPLTTIPDPFEMENSYGEYMNNQKLKPFLNKFGFEYEFISATEYYKQGKYNTHLKIVAEKYQDFLNIMLPTLGQERQATYSPFLPVDPDTNEMLTTGVIKINPDKCTITYKSKNGEIKESSFLNGGAKLQWKCDFAMRWAALNINYEIYGKDHFENEDVYKNLCRLFNQEPPVTYNYELFLAEDGKKISKTKGNGISVEQWEKYSCIESLALFMYQKPKTAKRLYFDSIPKATDEYLRYLSKFSTNDYENPVYFIDSKNTKQIVDQNISFNMLLNLASACNPDNKEILLEFIKKYSPSFDSQNSLYNKLTEGAIAYYNDFIKPNKKYKTIDALDKKILSHIIRILESNEYTNDTELQNEIYKISEIEQIETKKIFECFYNCILGQETGPRLGSFLFVYGASNAIHLINTFLHGKK